MLNVPNTLTLARIIAVPAFLVLLSDSRFVAALVVLVAAAVTDALDGAIARLTNTKTTLGAYLDPLADKLLLLSAFIALAFLNEVPRWLTVIVLSRDVVIVTGFFLLFVLTQRTMEIRPSAFGKGTTFFQLVSVIAALLRRSGIYDIDATLLTTLFVVTGVLTAVAGLQYMHRGILWVQHTPEERSGGDRHGPRMDD
jgi:cardiolipin synthase